jgi:hypothetical protein
MRTDQARGSVADIWIAELMAKKPLARNTPAVMKLDCSYWMTTEDTSSFSPEIAVKSGVSEVRVQEVPLKSPF